MIVALLLVLAAMVSSLSAQTEEPSAVNVPSSAEVQSDSAEAQSSSDEPEQKQPTLEPNRDTASADVENERRFNELRRELLDDRAKMIDWWLMFLAVIIPIIAIIGGIFSFRRFTEIKDEAQRHLEEVRAIRDKSELYLESFQATFFELQNRTGEAIEKWRSIANIAEGTNDELAADTWFANGAGKSNFISLFQMLAKLSEKRLQLFVGQQDGPDALLFGGRKRTQQLEAKFVFDENGYEFALVPAGERLIFADETLSAGGGLGERQSLGSGHEEARLPDGADDAVAEYIWPVIRSWRVYHFHDTTPSAPMRQAQAVRDNLRLKPDASNLASFLRYLREQYPENYERIVDTACMAAPFFGDFVYRRELGERLELEWFEAGDPDTVHGPRQLSDGTLRFICLATLLLQPAELQPMTILIDEPELGLHPYAVNLLGALLQQASETKQLIVSTQSVDLISALAPEDVIVVSREQGESKFERLDLECLRDWLEDYALGDLWKMNILGGRPTR